MNLIVDFGNSFVKIAVIENEKIIYSEISKNFGQDEFATIFQKYSNANKCIVSSVVDVTQDVISFLKMKSGFFIFLDEKTLLPFENLYKTPGSLGKDRLAAVAGAVSVFPDQEVLVIDLGTAITFDFVNSNRQYLGGNISPGLETRFKSLNLFTKKLPLLEKNENFIFLGDNTESAIISGVQNGIIFELDGYIDQLKNKFSDIKFILTGGDAIFFEKKLKNTIFAHPELNIFGLNIILEYNYRQNEK